MKLRRCYNCNSYTLKKICSRCHIESKEAHYKFIKIKDALKSDLKYFSKKH